MSISEAQLGALAIIPKVTGTLSILGSGCIIKSTIDEIRRETDNLYHRIMLGLSLVNIWSSFALTLSTVPIPFGTAGVWGAKGNTATCALQGFFVQQAYTAAVYNAALAVYYVLFSRYRWSETRLGTVEVYFHFIPLAVGVIIGGAGFSLDLYNNALLWCWIAPFPLGCKNSHEFGIDADCIRGDNAWIYRYAFAYAPLWASIVVATTCMVLVYRTVLQQEKDVDVRRHDGLAVRAQSKRVALQAFWYIVGFYLTWLPGTIVVIIDQILPATEKSVDYPFVFAVAVFMPLQGFFNAAVFFRAKYLKYLRDNPGAPIKEFLLKATIFYQHTGGNLTDGKKTDANTSDAYTSDSYNAETNTTDSGTENSPNTVDANSADINTDDASREETHATDATVETGQEEAPSSAS